MPKKNLNRFEALGKMMKDRREEVGLTQSELGLKLGYSSGQYIHYVESGKIVIPRSKLKKWLKAIDLTPFEYIEMTAEAQLRELCDTLSIPYKKALKEFSKSKVCRGV